MNENLLSIKINCPVEKLFEYTINPKNTHLWITSMKEEWINDTNIQIGTIYKNISLDSDNVSTYELINFEKNKLFHLVSKDSEYQVIYYYIKIDNDNCILNYYENMRDKSNLPGLLDYQYLKNLKNILEK